MTMNKDNTLDPPAKRTGRSILAVLGGLLLAALLSVGVDAIMHGTGVFPPVGQVVSNGLFALATLYRCAFQTLGGYFTARLAPARPMKHVWILAFIGFVLSLLGILAWKSMGEASGPLWYPLVLVVTAIPSVWVGGKVYLARPGNNREYR